MAQATLPTLDDIAVQKSTATSDAPAKLIGPSRGFVALNKLTPVELVKLSDVLGAQYQRNTNRSSAQCMFASHALPVTHIEAQYIALKMFDAIGIMRSEFSTGSIWHSNPKATARTLTGSKANYTSDMAQSRGLYTLRCATHSMRANRALCLRECLQVVVNESAKSLYTVATNKKFALTTTKRAKPTKRATTPTQANTSESDTNTSDTSESVA